MKKFMEEAFKIFWIPLIMAIVSYIFFQLKDVVLGIIVLVALSAAYTTIRLYVTHKKWWLLIILMVVLVASGGAYFLKAPTTSLTINETRITAAETNIGGAKILVSPAPKNGLYTKGTVITLTATAGSGQDWKSWVGTQNDATNPTTVKMDGSKQIRVNFDTRFSLIINNEMVIGSFLSFLEGDITVNPAPDNDGKYTSGTEVTLTVRPNTGYDWTSWSGTASDGANPAKVVMSGGNKNISVNFEGRFALVIDEHLVIGPTLNLTQGAVKVDPAPDEDGKYAYGTKVTLTGVPKTGFGWQSWTGTKDDLTNPVAITINSERHILVSFEERYLVMVNNQALKAAVLEVTGGTINAEPGPGDDSRFTKNSLATFTATPATGYRFDKWTGDVTDTVTAVSLLLDSNKSISAAFIKVYNLETSVNIAAGGTVSPAGGVYDTGTAVTLTAAPAAGYRFDKWTGDVTGNTPSVSVMLNNDIAAKANFIKTYLLTVSANPAEGGTVSNVSGTYDEGTPVEITAAPAAGYAFKGWDGVSGNETTVSVNMTADRTIIARFELAP